MNKIILLILFYAINSFAQIVTVKDESTKQPLELVSVYNLELNRALTTDTKGRVDIRLLKDSESISFRLMGYEKKTLSYNEIVEAEYEVLLTERPISINNVIVSAKRWEEDRSEIPHSIEFISPKELELQNPQTTADMLSQSGNVYVQKSQLGGGSPMIRGFATNRVLIVVDNVRMNTAIFRSGNLQNVISIDANSLANAQIIFGPGSVIYGSDAIGGVMEFNTLSPGFSYGGESNIKGSILTRYSSANNEKTGSINLSFGLEKWGFLSSVSYSDFSDLRMGSDGPADYLRGFYQDRINGNDISVVNNDPEIQKGSGYQQLNFMQKIRFKPNRDWEFNYGLHYSNTSDVPRYDRLIETRNGEPRSAEWYYGPQKWVMNNIAISNFSSNRVYDLSKIVLAYQFFEESRHDRKFNDSSLRSRTEKVDAFSANIDFVKNLNKSSQLYYGLETIYNKAGSSGETKDIITENKELTSSRYPDGSTWSSYGAYITYKNKLSEKYILQAGIRYSLVEINAEFDTTFFPFPFIYTELQTGAVTGSAGLAWHPRNDWQINFNLSTGFRAPNIDDIGKVFDSEPGSVVVPNPKLESEYVYSAELGIMKVFSNHLKLDLIGFYSYLDNALVRRNFSLNGRDSIYYDGILSRVQAIQNAASANVWGIQAGIDYKFADNFEFISKFSYQSGEEEDDSGNSVPLRHSAPWYGTTRLLYDNKQINAVIYADYNGEVSYDDLAPSEREKVIYALDDNGNPYSPSWYTFNIKIGYRMFGNLLINLSLENILDKRYRTYSSGISAPGRNFIASLKYTF